MESRTWAVRLTQAPYRATALLIGACLLGACAQLQLPRCLSTGTGAAPDIPKTIPKGNHR